MLQNLRVSISDLYFPDPESPFRDIFVFAAAGGLSLTLARVHGLMDSPRVSLAA